MGKPTICIGENKGAEQLRGDREADQRLCFRYSDSTIPPLLNSKISSFYPASVAVQAGLCQTCSETTLLVFPQGGSYINKIHAGRIVVPGFWLVPFRLTAWYNIYCLRENHERLGRTVIPDAIYRYYLI